MSDAGKLLIPSIISFFVLSTTFSLTFRISKNIIFKKRLFYMFIFVIPLNMGAIAYLLGTPLLLSILPLGIVILFLIFGSSPKF